MKRLITILILSAMLTGCATGTGSNVSVESGENNSSEISSLISEEELSSEGNTDSIYADCAKDIESVCNNAEKEFEEAKNKGYDNIDFLASSFRAPSFQQCYKLCLDAKFIPLHLTNKEAYDKFIELCNEYLGECEEESIHLTSFNKNLAPIEFERPIKATEHKELVESSEKDIYIFQYINNENNKYMWWNTKHVAPNWIVDGEIFGTGIETEKKANCLFPSSLLPEDKVIKHYNGKDDGEVYNLPNGKTTIKEAVDYLENEYSKIHLKESSDYYSLYVWETTVGDIDDEKQFFSFYTTLSYKGIPIEPHLSGLTIYGGTISASDKHFNMGQTLMLGKDNVDVIASQTIYPITNNTTELTKLIPFEKAMDIASEKLSEGTVFSLREADLIYSKVQLDTTIDGETTLYPHWRFNFFNPNDNKYLFAYVNAVNGQFDYFTYTEG